MTLLIIDLLILSSVPLRERTNVFSNQYSLLQTFKLEEGIEESICGFLLLIPELLAVVGSTPTLVTLTQTLTTTSHVVGTRNNTHTYTQVHTTVTNGVESLCVS